MPARALGRVATAAATEAGGEEERVELAGEAPARALGREATAATTEVAEERLELAGVKPARAARRVPRSDPPRGVWLAVVSAAPGAREPEAGTEDRRCQRAAEGSVCTVGGLAAKAGPDAERLSSAAFARSSALRKDSAAVTCWRVNGAADQAEVQVEVEEDEGVGAGAGAGAETVGRGAAGLAGGGLHGCLALLFFAAADAGRQTACWRVCGGAQAGKGGIVCHRCSGTGACSKAAFVMGC